MDDQLRQAFERGLEWQRTHSDELFADQVRRGVINEKGEVLIRVPEPPEEVSTTQPEMSRNGALQPSINDRLVEQANEKVM